MDDSTKKQLDEYIAELSVQELAAFLAAVINTWINVQKERGDA